MNITMLRQKKTDTLAKAKAVGVLAEKENRDLTDAERVEYDATMASVNVINGDIARAEAMLDAERTAPAVAHNVIVGKDHATEKPWGSLGEQLLAVRNVAITQGRTVDPRLFAAAQGSNEAVDAEGGFLVAPEYSDTILQRTYQEGQVTSRCQTVPMSSNRLIMNGLDEDSRANGSRYGGISVYRIAEAASYTSSKPKFKRIELNANKLIGLLYATDEVLDDAAALSKWASTNFPKAFSFQLDDEAINGTGSGQMLGILNSGAAVTVAKDASQTNTTVTSTNFTGMWGRMWAPSRKNAVWFINQDVESQLYGLTIPGQTGTNVALYIQPGYGSNNSEYGTILGKPVIPIEQCATLGTLGDVILADMDQYLIGQKEGLKADSSIHVAFLTGEQTFRWTLRNDGQPIPKKPLTPYKGTNTTSPFVVLAGRP